jgi:hypothetical protein
LLGLNEGEKSAVRPLSIEQRVERAVKTATRHLDAQAYLLRKELDEFKVVQAANGARF